MTAVTIFLLALTVVSCDTGTGSTKQNGAKTPGSVTSTTVVEHQGRAAFATAKGMLLIGCDLREGRATESGRAYIVLDPATGQVRADFDAVRDVGTPQVRGGGPLEPATTDFCREPRALSPDRRRLAMARSNFDDGSSHVGWVELATGRQTDLTAASVGNDFAAATPKDTHPRFGRDGRLYFDRSGTTLMVADEAAKVTNADPAAACTAQATCGRLTHASGKFFLDDEPPQNGVRLGTTDPAMARDDQHDAYAIDLPLTVQGKPWKSVRILYWINDRSLLCRGGDDEEYRVVTINTQGLPLDTRADVELPPQEAGPLAIPKTDRKIQWTAPTPDGQSLIFSATRGDERARLYRVALGGTAEPTELGPVPGELDGRRVIWIPSSG